MLIMNLVEGMASYLVERERIRLQKEAGAKPPFTEDWILQKFKFTNVLREHDRCSRWAIQNWYRPNHNQPLELQLLNCAIFRYFGTWEFAEALGWQDDFRPTNIVYLAKERLAQKKRVFTGAYVITNGGISAPKEEVVVHEYLTPFWRKAPDLVRIAQKTNRWEAVALECFRLPGFGGTGFMTKEVLSDAMFTAVLENVTDRLTWSPAGPGARRGLNRLHGRPYEGSLPFDRALNEMRELHPKLVAQMSRHEHMHPILDRFDLHAVQFSLCEYDKYLRVKNGEGRPRSTYKPSPLPLS